MARLDPCPDRVADAIFRSVVRMDARRAALRIQERCGIVPLTPDERELLGALHDLLRSDLAAGLPAIRSRLLALHAACRPLDGAAEPDCRLCRAGTRCAVGRQQPVLLRLQTSGRTDDA